MSWQIIYIKTIVLQFLLWQRQSPSMIAIRRLDHVPEPQRGQHGAQVHMHAGRGAAFSRDTTKGTEYAAEAVNAAGDGQVLHDLMTRAKHQIPG